MQSWENIQARKAEMQSNAVAALTKEETAILQKVLEVELENRHLQHTAAASEIRKTIKNFVMQEFK